MPNKPDYVVVSFSGGKDSTAMLLHMIELGEHIDEIIFCDTGLEFPAMYVHIQQVRKIIDQHHLKFTILKSEHSFEYLLLEKPIESKKYGLHYGFGWSTSQIRWCTKHLKIKIINEHLKPLKEQFNLIQCIGLASDELDRASRNNNIGKRNPLIEWGWTESDCLAYCKGLGYTWGGLYDIFNRLSCWCCPLQAISELRKLWWNFPDLWRQLEKWELEIQKNSIFPALKFREDSTVFDLAIRFENEKIQEIENTRKQKENDRCRRTLDDFICIE